MVVWGAVDSVKIPMTCAAFGQRLENARRIPRTCRLHAENLAGHVLKSRKLNPLLERSFATSFEMRGFNFNEVLAIAATYQSFKASEACLPDHLHRFCANEFEL
jgi:hypothetical protein